MASTAAKNFQRDLGQPPNGAFIALPTCPTRDIPSVCAKSNKRKQYLDISYLRARPDWPIGCSTRAIHKVPSTHT